MIIAPTIVSAVITLKGRGRYQGILVRLWSTFSDDTLAYKVQMVLWLHWLIVLGPSSGQRWIRSQKDRGPCFLRSSLEALGGGGLEVGAGSFA